MIRILICDDQAVVCEGLRAILSTVNDFVVVGVAYDGQQAIELAERLKPDIILMDMKMPVMSGVQATAEICSRFPQMYVLALSTYDMEEWVLDAIRNGACGYLLKDTPSKEIIAALYGTVKGKNYIDPAVAGKMMNQVKKSRQAQSSENVKLLTDREKEILAFIGSGLTNQEIAARLFLSEGTIRNYVSSIFFKLQVTDRTQAAILALRSGLEK